MPNKFRITQQTPSIFKLSNSLLQQFKITQQTPSIFKVLTTDITKPSLLSVILSDPLTLRLTFDEFLKESVVPDLSDFVFVYSGKYIYKDWFLPSQDLLKAMHDNLNAFGVGNFIDDNYWSSTETGASSVKKVLFLFGGIVGDAGKLLGTGVDNYIRPCRKFTAALGAYSLRDTGPVGGLICYIDGTTYYESGLVDVGLTQAWSNITNVEIGATAQGTIASTSQGNTTAIISQSGHTTSAAKLCNDYFVEVDITIIASVVSILEDVVTVALSYPVQFGETLSAQYIPGVNKIQDLSGNLADAFTQAVDASIVVAPPVITSVEVGTVANNSWRIVFDIAIYATMPDVSSFRILGFTFASVTKVGSNEIELISNEDAVSTGSYSIEYVQPLANQLQGANDNYVVNFTHAVTNNVPIPVVRIDSTIVKIDSTLITIDNGI